MNTGPDAAELLRVARKLLREDLMEAVPSERRYEALMVANAMAIAARESAAGDADLRQELLMLTELYGEKIVAVNMPILYVAFAWRTCHAEMADWWHGDVASRQSNETFLNQGNRVRNIQRSNDVLAANNLHYAALIARSRKAADEKYSPIFSSPGSR